MVTKFYSEVLNKYFDSEDACVAAEKAHEEAEAEKKQTAVVVSKKKRELASAVEAADSNLNQAYADYELTKDEANKIIREANDKALELLKPAKDAVEKAQQERYAAISNFNKQCGVYTTTYTGERAYQEFLRTSKWFDDLFNKLFW